MPAPGDILSARYLLNDELGAGGMGTVFRAVDLRTGGQVAVRVPHASLSRDRTFVERFRREAQVAAALHSPRVVMVTDYAEHEGLPYLVMEFVPGESLADRLSAGTALPAGEALSVALEVARALDAAHASGIVHGGLKPQNIRLTASGDVKVVNFGIARRASQPGITGDGDIRADIYSLGVVLYQMLSGHVPFAGELHREGHTGVVRRPIARGVPVAGGWQVAAVCR